jgi:hypothetical protein
MARPPKEPLSREPQGRVLAELSPEEMNRRANYYIKKKKSLEDRDPKPRRLPKRTCQSIKNRLDVCSYIRNIRIVVEPDYRRRGGDSQGRPGSTTKV